MREDRNPAPVVTQLVLVTPVLGDPADFLPALSAALAAGPVAAVIARFEASDERTLVNRIKELASTVQAGGAALMVEGPVEAVVRGGADGIHLVYQPELLSEAVSRLAPQRMVGVAGLKSKDDAMASGEAGADYVMFGEPAVSRHAEKNGVVPPFHAVVERVAWWAEVFEVPVVGHTPDIAGAAALAKVHADFVALGAPVWDHPEGPAAAVAEALARIKSGPAA
ncbi:thiamine phosphate synthase [Phreatobacter sp. HK31-P]